MSSSLSRNEHDLKVKYEVFLTYILLFVTPAKTKDDQKYLDIKTVS